MSPAKPIQDQPDLYTAIGSGTANINNEVPDHCDCDCCCCCISGANVCCHVCDKNRFDILACSCVGDLCQMICECVSELCNS